MSSAPASPVEPRNVDLPVFWRVSEIAPRSISEEDRSVELIWTAGAPVVRWDWYTGSRYIERLSCEPDHVRLKRLNSGAPLLDTHMGWRLNAILGTVEKKSASVDGKKGIARVRFSRRAEVEPIWQDVRDGIISKVSTGYVVHEFDETPGKRKGDLPTRLAIDWEPHEVSLVPMPADVDAEVRDGGPALIETPDIVLREGKFYRLVPGKPDEVLQSHTCRIFVRSADALARSEEPQPMNPEPAAPSVTIAERNPLDPGAPIPRAEPQPVAEPNALDVAATAERNRINGIRSACRIARIPLTIENELIDGNVSLVEAQARVLAEIEGRGGQALGPQVTAVRISGTEDPLVHVRAGIRNALLHRLNSGLQKRDGTPLFSLDDNGRRYRGMTMLDVARAYLQARNIRVTDMSKSELAGVALGLSDARGAGYHSASDFPDLLADVANKSLRAAYDEQPQTFRPIVRIAFLPDFKAVNRVQLGDAPGFLEVGENGEYTTGTISDGKETYQLATYGRKFAITRKALINDDTDAFSRVPSMFGRKARILESNLVWAQITGNPTMGDGQQLFSAAHGNLQTDGDVISITSLGRARATMGVQTSLDGDFLNLAPVWLIVPVALQTLAEQFVAVVTPQAAGNVNPFQNRLQVIAEPRLDANSTQAWYLAASAQQIDIVELAYLDGMEGPAVESRVGFDVDGLEVKARLDVAAKAIDWRGLHKDPGENAT